jgi:YD repeat-containing protein/predicted outer membrane repeat protein
VNFRSRTYISIAFIILLIFVILHPAFAATVHYEYDNLHRLTKAQYSNGITYSYTYDALGNCTSMQVTSSAATYVPTDYPTIQAALAAAADGGTIIVRNGSYTLSSYLDFGGKNVTLKSEGGPQNCILDVSISGLAFFFHSGETASTVVSGFTIKNGSQRGSGFYCVSASPTIDNCIFQGNTSPDFGAAIYCAQSSPRILNCIFTGNAAATSGGALYADSSSPVVTNCILTGNTATYGGAIFGGGLTITNCTFSGNTASFGGALAVNSGSATVANSILWGDTPQEIYNFAGTTTVAAYSDIQGGWAGAGCKNADPRFVDQANLNFHLAVGSPCLNAGSNAVTDLPPRDIEGHPRIFGGVIDMGAYEEVSPKKNLPWLMLLN